MVALPVVMIPIAIFSRKIRRSSREAQTLIAELTQTMAEAFTGHRIVKAYNLEPIVPGSFKMPRAGSSANICASFAPAAFPARSLNFSVPAAWRCCWRI